MTRTKHNSKISQSSSSRIRKIDGRDIPKHSALREVILDLIQTGGLKNGERLPSEGELVRQYKVSSTTVRRCLRDLAEDGYIVRQRGRTGGNFVADLAKPSVCSGFGILTSSLFSSVGMPSFPLHLAGLEKYVVDLGHMLHLFTSHMIEHSQNPASLLSQFVERYRLLGLFIISPLPEFWFDEMVRRRFPIVSVNIDYPNAPIPKVLADSETLAYRSGQYLVDLGHRRISTLLGRMKSITVIAAGAERAMCGLKRVTDENPDAGISFESIIYDYLDREHTRAQINEIINRQPERRPTAILVGEDVVAQMVWDIALANGLSVPGDLSIMSLQGGMPHARLTTTEIGYDHICWRAVRIMEQLLDGETPRRLRELVGGDLHIGASTGPPRS